MTLDESMNPTATQNYIMSANPDLLGGKLRGEIKFTPGLNIVSGENGTLKTKLLQFLRSGGGGIISAQPNVALKIQSISPKRNSERRATESILQTLRTQNRNWDSVLHERLQAQIVDSGFDNYPSLGDLFYLVFEDKSKDGGSRKEHMGATTSEFNQVIRAVFPQYELISTWDNVLGSPRVRMQKHSTLEFAIEHLSLGEQEVLSLVTSMNAARNGVDTYLIDEPEVHLNWHLEDRLFEFMDRLCEENHKQAIVVTHSRTIFKPKFLSKSQFFYWDTDGTVRWTSSPNQAQKQRLAGDAIQIVGLGEFSKPTFFVEDSAHEIVINALARVTNASIVVTQCGNSGNVRSLFKHQKTEGGWVNTYFVSDGDNQGNPYPGEPAFIHLPYYSIENALLDPELLSRTCSKSVEDIQSLLTNSILQKKDSLFKKNKFFEFLASYLAPSHMTFENLKHLDASIVIEPLLAELGKSLEELAFDYVSTALDQDRLRDVFPDNLIQSLNTATDGI